MSMHLKLCNLDHFPNLIQDRVLLDRLRSGLSGKPDRRNRRHFAGKVETWRAGRP
jgi:hypothetical protein